MFVSTYSVFTAIIIIIGIIIRTDDDPSLRIESFAIINLRGVSTKLYFNKSHCVYTGRKVFPGTQQKTHNLFWPDENSIEQCFAAHIVQGC